MYLSRKNIETSLTPPKKTNKTTEQQKPISVSDTCVSKIAWLSMPLNQMTGSVEGHTVRGLLEWPSVHYFNLSNTSYF